jgi:glycosyltransferase involved in cell wall biosynthesis
MKNLKFEIILAYYKRPKIVLNALNSILNSTYTNWHLSFIDDSGDELFKEDLFNFGFNNEKIEYIPILMSDSEKSSLGGSVHGKYMNEAIKKTDSDIIIILCDDDAIDHSYMENLNIFFNSNPDEMWCYSHVKFFNPNIESYLESSEGGSSIGSGLIFLLSSS